MKCFVIITLKEKEEEELDNLLFSNLHTKHIKILTRFSLQLGKIMEDKGKMDELIEQMKLMNVLLS